MGQVLDASATASAGVVHVPASGHEFSRPDDWVSTGRSHLGLRRSGTDAFGKNKHDESEIEQW